MSAQAKPISEVVKEFEQSLENLRPSTRRVYVAAAKTAIRSAHLELWQCHSPTELLASIGKSPAEKRARISPFLDFLDDGGSKQSVSDEEIVSGHYKPASNGRNDPATKICVSRHFSSKQARTNSLMSGLFERKMPLFS